MFFRTILSKGAPSFAPTRLSVYPFILLHYFFHSTYNYLTLQIVYVIT